MFPHGGQIKLLNGPAHKKGTEKQYQAGRKDQILLFHDTLHLFSWFESPATGCGKHHALARLFTPTGPTIKNNHHT
jgi:hypothetical protein